MKYIKSYKVFESMESTLYIFDFDDTIGFATSFDDMAISYLNEDLKELVDKSLTYIDVDRKDVKWEDGRIFVDDPNSEIVVKGNWVKKGNRLYMITPHKWSFIDESFPTKLTPLAELYKSVENKAIVTARPIDVKDKLIEVIDNLGLEQPNYGLYMFPRQVGAGNPASWKAKTVIEIIEQNSFKTIHFYDDNKKVLNKVTREVKDKLRDILFKSYLVKEGVAYEIH